MTARLQILQKSLIIWWPCLSCLINITFETMTICFRRQVTAFWQSSSVRKITTQR